MDVWLGWSILYTYEYLYVVYVNTRRENQIRNKIAINRKFLSFSVADSFALEIYSFAQFQCSRVNLFLHIELHTNFQNAKYPRLAASAAMSEMSFKHKLYNF